MLRISVGVIPLPQITVAYCVLQLLFCEVGLAGDLLERDKDAA